MSSWISSVVAWLSSQVGKLLDVDAPLWEKSSVIASPVARGRSRDAIVFLFSGTDGQEFHHDWYGWYVSLVRFMRPHTELYSVMCTRCVILTVEMWSLWLSMLWRFWWVRLAYLMSSMPHLVYRAMYSMVIKWDTLANE